MYKNCGVLSLEAAEGVLEQAVVMSIVRVFGLRVLLGGIFMKG